nr:hypothetical protein [uncultured Lachnoanaerobaculum sp.]
MVPLIKKVTNAKQIKEDFLHRSFPVEEQKKFMDIHTYGFLYEAPKLMKMVTGENFDVKYFLDYIEEKYTKLY